MKKYILLFALLLTGLVACNSKKEVDLSPEQYWTMEQQDSVMLRILPYLAKLPRKATHETKFESQFQEYYNELLPDFKFRALSPSANGEFYFLMDRPAPSLYGKRIAIAGKLKVDMDSYVVESYEEIFWTFKLKEPVLTERAMFLFQELLAGRSLEPYLPMNSEAEFIEFPDKHNRFNRSARKWEFHQEEQ
ncbi:MAG: hypothetical protein Q8J69_02290 [Sphingobacteriaceae bacterium]|nr:hypothetical protein [Sphingobacteriaceae bacterium]